MIQPLYLLFDNLRVIFIEKALKTVEYELVQVVNVWLRGPFFQGRFFDPTCPWITVDQMFIWWLHKESNVDYDWRVGVK